MKVPFHRPAVSARAMHLVADAVNSNWITTGPMTERLEAMVRELTGARHAIAVNSATTGMMLVASWRCRQNPRAFDYWHSVPALGGHFAANALVWADMGCLKAVDCEDDLTTSDWRGSLNVISDYGGRAAACSGIADGSFTLCDSAYSLGGTGRDGKPIGTQADAHVFSLQATKQITCGEGGIITTEIDELAAWLKRARCHGMDADAHTRTVHGYDIMHPGGAFMLPDLLAAVAISQMETEEKRRHRRLDIRRAYDSRSQPYRGRWGSDPIGATVPYHARDAHGLHVLRIPSKLMSVLPGDKAEWCPEWGRDRFIELMAERGVACKQHYEYLPNFTAWKHLDRRDSPNAEKAAAEVVSLPLFSDLSDEEVEYVCKSARECLAELEG